MNIISLYLAFDNKLNFLGMCSNKDILIQNLRFADEYEVRYIEFTNDDFINSELANNSCYIERIKNN